MKTLATDRLIIRRMTTSTADAQFMLQLLNDSSWIRYIGDRGVRNEEDARQYISAGPMDMYDRLGYGFCMVEARESRCALGICGLAKRDYLDYPDIGFAFLPQHWGQGFAYEAALAMLRYATNDLGMPRIVATTRADNLSSQALLRKLGLQFERTFLHPDGDRELQLYSTFES
ncbi:MAG: GNAT family N-acetyltransferase [Burkholderiaceae bacterium]|nr:GNAT family N-acetyltransferase [Burkholderiaceae bacterium]